MSDGVWPSEKDAGFFEDESTVPAPHWKPVPLRLGHGAHVPVQLQAAQALHFLCSHFKIIRAALESIRVSSALSKGPLFGLLTHL